MATWSRVWKRPPVPLNCSQCWSEIISGILRPWESPVLSLFRSFALPPAELFHALPSVSDREQQRVCVPTPQSLASQFWRSFLKSCTGLIGLETIMYRTRRRLSFFIVFLMVFMLLFQLDTILFGHNVVTDKSSRVPNTSATNYPHQLMDQYEKSMAGTKPTSEFKKILFWNEGAIYSYEKRVFNDVLTASTVQLTAAKGTASDLDARHSWKPNVQFGNVKQQIIVQL